MPFCEKCNEWFYKYETHNCPPTWQVWDEEYHENREDGRTIQAVDAENAATKFCEWYDSWSADYDIVGGHRAPVICVAAPGHDGVHKFRVRGETVPHYTVEKIP